MSAVEGNPVAPRQWGGALVEFAFLLPFLLALLIGVIYYGYAFMLQAAVSYAAREGAQVAVAVDPIGLSTSDYQAAVSNEAEQAVRNSLNWLPAAVSSKLEAPDITFSADGGRVNVRVVLSTAGGGGLLPQASLPIVGAIPPSLGDVVGVAEVAL